MMKKTTASGILFFLFSFSTAAQMPNTGFSLSPKGHRFTYDSLPQFFTEVTTNCPGSVVYGSGRWYDSAAVAGTVPGLASAITGLTPAPYNYTDMLTLGWATYPYTYYLDPQGGVNNWTNMQTRALYLQTLAATADLHPAYLFVGNEVNFYIESDSLDYSNWVSFYHQAYDTIKAHSPQTKVGTVFNYEHMSGQGQNLAPMPWTAAHWSALTMIDTSKMDVVALNTYPFLHYLTVNAIPNNYLQPFFDSIGNKPVVITETGWPADDFGLTAWIGTPSEQAAYVNKFFTLINGHNVEAANWLFLYYQMDYSQTLEDAVFCSVSMYDSLGNSRPAYSLWQAQCAITGAEQPSFSETWQVHALPNPASGTVRFELKTNTGISSNATLEIFDAIGQRKESDMLGINTSISLDITGYAPGVYFYRISDEKGGRTASGSFIVN